MPTALRRHSRALANTMKLISAKSEDDWMIASDILLNVIDHLNKMGKSLWNYRQADTAHLKEAYKLNELYFYRSENEIYGMVFIQNADPLFWPEVVPNESYFMHKLAVLPKFKGKGFGYKILDSVLELARTNGVKYVRLDCDPRAELTSYYQSYGFTFVSKAVVSGFPVVKYELLTKHCT